MQPAPGYSPPAAPLSAAPPAEAPPAPPPPTPPPPPVAVDDILLTDNAPPAPDPFLSAVDALSGALAEAPPAPPLVDDGRDPLGGSLLD